MFARHGRVAVVLLCVFLGHVTHAVTDRRFARRMVRGERHIVAVIASFNNAAWYKRNLDSIFDQRYDNYHVIYIDDCSTDGTYDLVQAYVKERGQEQRVAVFKNEQNVGALCGQYHAVHACDDKTIIVTIDGDDWLKHENAFGMLNDAYDDKNVLMTYGQYEEYPEWKLGQCQALPAEVIEKVTYRQYSWRTSQLRTFYAGLFKRVKREDLIDSDGNFFKVAGDIAFMFPMLEMAGGRIRFISDIIYVYNQTPFNDFRINRPEQYRIDMMIRSRKPYGRLGDTEAHVLSADW